MFNNISIIELKKINPHNIIDIRDNLAYNKNHIPGAINIELNMLLIKPEIYLSKNKAYYIYCNKGIQSKKLCQILANNGYNVINIIGGYKAYVLNEQSK